MTTPLRTMVFIILIRPTLALSSMILPELSLHPVELHLPTMMFQKTQWRRGGSDKPRVVLELFADTKREK